MKTAVALCCALLAASPVAAQDAPRVDFARDVQPIFRASCIGCHGQAIHQNGFRLDRRSDAMRGGTLPMIGRGNADASRLYLRLTGTTMGPQMPPTGALKPEQIALIKAWIDQGAEWPDAVSGETPPPPPDPLAVSMIDALRAGNHAAFRAAADAAGQVGARKGTGGTTPLMQAAIYGSVEDMRLLLERGADINARNDSGVTALHLAVHDIEKTRLLVDHAANVNASTDHARTPLMSAAGRTGAAAVVKLLLEHGADPSASGTGTTPLMEAALVGEEPVFRMLLDAGAKLGPDAPLVPVLALRAGCVTCATMVLDKMPAPLVTEALVLSGPPNSDLRRIDLFLNRGADANAADSQGRTVLMLAVSTDGIPLEVVKALIQRGADVNARSKAGETALSIAKTRGARAIIDFLKQAGAAESDPVSAAPTPNGPAASARAAVERSLPLLQRSDETFQRKAGCVSCHNNTLTAMTVSSARAAGITVNEAIASQQRTAIATFLDSWRDRVLQGIGVPGDNDTISYILLGLAAEGQPSDAATEAMVHFLLRQQLSDGRFRVLAHRPPIESSDIEVTAATARALQLYTSPADRAAVERAVKGAGAWLQSARNQTRTNEDRVFLLLGLQWTGAPAGLVQAAARALTGAQRPDGGWAQLDSLESDAYATGQALYALAETGTSSDSDPVFNRGVKFLLDTQLADGSWFVQSRAIPLQPYFESGFPYGRNQWISAAGTNWATLALTRSLKKGR